MVEIVEGDCPGQKKTQKNNAANNCVSYSYDTDTHTQIAYTAVENKWREHFKMIFSFLNSCMFT